MRLLNLTPHPLTLFRNGEKVGEIEPDGPPLRLEIVSKRKLGTLRSTEGLEVPLNDIERELRPDPPDPLPTTYIVVSARVKAWADYRDDFVSVEGQVKDGKDTIGFESVGA